MIPATTAPLHHAAPPPAQVTQGSASETDLLALAEGCLLTAAHHAAASDSATAGAMRDEAKDDDDESAAPPSRHRLRGLCRAFQELQRDGRYWAPHAPRENGAAGLFHQRDFVYLCVLGGRMGSVGRSGIPVAPFPLQPAQPAPRDRPVH